MQERKAAAEFRVGPDTVTSDELMHWISKSYPSIFTAGVSCWVHYAHAFCLICSFAIVLLSKRNLIIVAS